MRSEESVTEESGAVPQVLGAQGRERRNWSYVHRVRIRKSLVEGEDKRMRGRRDGRDSGRR